MGGSATLPFPLRALTYDGTTAVVSDVTKPARGRLGDILEPLVQVVRLMAPHREEELLNLVEDLLEARLSDKSQTQEGRIIRVVINFPLLAILGIVHGFLPTRYPYQTRTWR